MPRRVFGICVLPLVLSAFPGPVSGFRDETSKRRPTKPVDAREVVRSGGRGRGRAQARLGSVSRWSLRRDPQGQPPREPLATGPQQAFHAQSCAPLTRRTTPSPHSLGPHGGRYPHPSGGYTEAPTGWVTRLRCRVKSQPRHGAPCSPLPRPLWPLPDPLLLQDVQPLGPLDDLQDGLHLGRAEALALPLLLGLVGVHRPACLQPRERTTQA